MDTHEEKTITQEKLLLKKFGARHYQVILFFFGLSLAMAMRINLSVAIVAMTNKESNSNFQV